MRLHSNFSTLLLEYRYMQVYVSNYNSHTPNIGLGRESIESEAFRGCPLDGEFGTSVGSVRVIFHQPSKTKVGHFHQVIVTNQTVSCRQVSATNSSLTVYSSVHSLHTS